MEKSSKELGITLKDPFMNVINYSEQDRDFISKQTLWVASLEKELEEGKSPPQIIVFYLQSYEESFYSVIKREVINRYGMASQVVKASTF